MSRHVPIDDDRISLIETQTVTGAAVTSITFDGLNGDTDEVYEIVGRIKNAGAPASVVYLIPNGVVTAQSGINWESNDSPASGASADASNMRLGQLTASGYVAFKAIFWAKTGQWRLLQSSVTSRSGAGTLATYVYSGAWADTSTLLTSLDVTASVAGAFDVGSKISLYRRQP